VEGRSLDPTVPYSTYCSRSTTRLGTTQRENDRPDVSLGNKKYFGLATSKLDIFRANCFLPGVCAPVLSLRSLTVQHFSVHFHPREPSHYVAFGRAQSPLATSPYHSKAFRPVPPTLVEFYSLVSSKTRRVIRIHVEARPSRTTNPAEESHSSQFFPSFQSNVQPLLPPE